MHFDLAKEQGEVNEKFVPLKRFHSTVMQRPHSFTPAIKHSALWLPFHQRRAGRRVHVHQLPSESSIRSPISN